MITNHPYWPLYYTGIQIYEMGMTGVEPAWMA